MAKASDDEPLYYSEDWDGDEDLANEEDDSSDGDDSGSLEEDDISYGEDEEDGSYGEDEDDSSDGDDSGSLKEFISEDEDKTDTDADYRNASESDSDDDDDDDEEYCDSNASLDDDLGTGLCETQEDKDENDHKQVMADRLRKLSLDQYKTQ
jgi:hypothetical protein